MQYFAELYCISGLIRFCVLSWQRFKLVTPVTTYKVRYMAMLQNTFLSINRLYRAKYELYNFAVFGPILNLSCFQNSSL